MKPFSADTTCIAIMSYNRGEYLQNCVASVERYLPGYSFTIFDDGSTDPASRRVLDNLRRRHRIVDCRSRSEGDRGGLHANMNVALDDARDHGFEYVWFIQDDMQVVRPIDSDFVDNVNRLFACDASIAQADPTFFRGYWTNAVLHARIAINSDPPAYRPTLNAGWNDGLVDLGIVSLARIDAVDFRFAESEFESKNLAEKLGIRRAHPRDPIMCFTPWPEVVPRRANSRPSWRDRIRAMLVRFQERVMNAGCHPFEPWTDEAVAAFKSRPISHYPVADRYLKTARPLAQPWWFSACSDLSEIRRPWRLFSLKWRSGQPKYRRHVSEKIAHDGADWMQHAGEPPRETAQAADESRVVRTI